MVSLLSFVLLFNLTYMLTQGSKEQNIFHDNIPYIASANDSKFKNISKSSTQSSTNKISDQQNIDVSTPTVLKLQSDPFSGKDVYVIQRQVGEGNEALDQNLEKPNTEEHQGLALKAKEGNESNKKVVVGSTAGSTAPKQNKTNSTVSENKNLGKSSTSNPTRVNSKEDIMQSGALIRGFYVFLGLSVITMVYFIFRSYRLRHGSQPSTTVRKYGVTARRSDMEMRPLELDDDDDDTLFEIGNQNAHR